MRAKSQQPRFARAVVEPEDAFDVVAEADFGPVAFAKGADGKGVLPFEITAHQLDDAGISRRFVIGLEDVEHEHVRPEIGFAVQAGEQLARAEPAVLALGGQGGVNPLFGLRHDGMVLEDVTQIAIALEPVGHFLPAELALALGIGPGAFGEIQPGGDLLQMAGHAVAFQLELMAQPAAWGDGADGQFAKRRGRQRRTIGGVEGVGGGGGRAFHHGHLGETGGHGSEKAEGCQRKGERGRVHFG